MSDIYIILDSYNIRFINISDVLKNRLISYKKIEILLSTNSVTNCKEIEIFLFI